MIVRNLSGKLLPVLSARKREMIMNWLAVLVLLSVGIVWPPAFGA